MSKKTEYRPDIWRAYFAPLLPLPCSKCGLPVMPEQTWDVDHIVPRIAGGLSTADNLTPAHRLCNRAHGARITHARRKAKRQADSGMLGLL